MPILSVFPQRITGFTPASSPIVAAVFEHVMERIQTGELTPGSPIKDVEIAAEFGVSRTPVREAIQLLRDVGVLEVSASRFTRVAETTPERTRQAFTVWYQLHVAAVRQLLTAAPLPELHLSELERYHRATAAASDAHDRAEFALAQARFYDFLLALVDNPALQRATSAVVHDLRLGAALLPQGFDEATIVRSQALLIDAMRTADASAARAALAALESIYIPVH